MKTLSNRNTYLVLFVIFILGFLLRVYPGNENLIWSYDQARDSVVIRSIIDDKNIIIVGPQTEFVGLSHGPLYYYLFSIFFHLGQSNLTIPLLAMIVLNLSSIIPIYLLAKSLSNGENRVGIIASFLFIIAYQQIEYARWLSNVSITVPFLAWFYYFLWKITNQKTANSDNLQNIIIPVLTGLSLALAIQGELFLLYLIPISYFCMYYYRIKFKKFLLFHIGLVFGLATFIIAEIKFGFLATNTFINDFIFNDAGGVFDLNKKLLDYFTHLGLTTYQNIIGYNSVLGLISLFLILILFFKTRKNVNKNVFSFILILLFSHSILFIFKYVNAVFLDLSITLPIILLFTLSIWFLIKTNKKIVAVGLLFLIIISQLFQLYSNTKNKTPMQIFNFHQGGILFSQKKEIVNKIYELVKNHSVEDNSSKFTLGVLGSPYGVQTVWATIFENYLSNNPNEHKPDWYGFRALGYPYDSYFTKVDHPESIHVLIIEDNILVLSNEIIVNEYISQLNKSTEIINQIKIYGFIIQIRKPIEH